MRKTRQRSLRLWSCAAAVVLATASGIPVGAQVSPEEHAQHHPNQAQGGDTHGEGEGMEGMMERMGAPAPKDLYPRLMDLPDLPLEERSQIESDAHQRMLDGTARMSDGFERLTRAASGDDFETMQEATAAIREGLSQFESGLAAHRALREGRAPRNVALEWFRSEMNLLPPAAPETGGRLLGMSGFHFSVMVLLTVFAVVVIWMYFFKMRRATALLERLTTTPPADSGQALQPESTSPPAQDLPLSRQIPTESARQSGGVVSADECCEGSAATSAAICPSEQMSGGDAGVSLGLLPVTKRKLCRLRVARITRETEDVKTFRFVSCHGGGIPFSYFPGQFLTLTLPIAEKPIRRSYTISSSPTQGYYCEITVKREEQGAGSRYLHDKVRVGDTLQAQAPSGKFIFTGHEANSIVLIAGGVGITPIMSVTRALTDMVWGGDIYVVVACHDPEHFIFETELKRLEQQCPNLHVFAAMSQVSHDTDGYRKGRLSREMLEEWVPDIASRRIHLCGPPAMMDAVKRMLDEIGVPRDNIFTENFGGEQKPRVRAEQRAAIAETEIAETGGTVNFERSGRSTRLLPDETVLEASERIGVDIDYSCRVGMCGVCTVKLISGNVSMEVEDGLEEEDREAGMILACQAKSTGDVVVDA